MTLTPAQDSDIEAVAALVNGAYRGDGAKAGWTHEADYIGGQRTDPAALRADLAANPRALLLIHRDAPGEPPLACVWLEPLDEPGDEPGDEPADEPGVWYLGMLTVHPDLQDRKLGRDVLAAAEAYAAGQGAHRMRMTVVGIRDTLIAWYQRRGWRLTGETRPFPYDDHRFGFPRRDDLTFVVLEKPL